MTSEKTSFAQPSGRSIDADGGEINSDHNQCDVATQPFSQPTSFSHAPLSSRSADVLYLPV
jgi:hypothetical protein